MIMANNRQPIISYSCLTVTMFLMQLLTTQIFKVIAVLATSGVPKATLTDGFDFQHEVSC